MTYWFWLRIKRLNQLYMIYPHASWHGDCRYRDVSRSSLSGGWIRIGELISWCFFWLCWVFIAVRGLSLGVVTRELLVVMVCGLITAVASPCRARALGAWASVVVAHGLSCSVACGIQIRDWTHVPCIGRWTLNHLITREVPEFFKKNFFYWSIVDYNVVLLNSKSQQSDSYIYVCVFFFIFFFHYRL